LEHTFYGPRFGKSEYVDDGIPTIRTTDMSGGTLELLADVPRVKVTDPKKVRLYELLENDLLITRTGSIGVMALFPGGYLAFPSAYLIRCRLMDADLGPFVFMLLQSPFGQDHLGLNTKTGNRPNINSGGIISTLVPLPPLAEQAAIVERVEALMTTCRLLAAEIEHARTHAAHLLQAVLKEAFAPAS
jgi:type I restriction enzyme S subunit